MEQELAIQFDRLETAFQELIESITTYNPSVKAAEELLLADEDLSKGLERLVRHQQNHVRLFQLRQTTEQLDSQIKSTISSLAQARKELLSTPWTDTPQNSRKVLMDELLAYAKRISKFSLPPNYRGAPAAQEAAAQTSTAGASSAIANGAMKTPTLDHAKDAETPAEPKSEPAASQDGRGAMWDSLPENTRAWLDQMKNAEFLPWPSHELIRNGILGDIQGQIERGEDPWSKLTPEQQEEADKQRKEDEGKEAESERRERDEREALRMGSLREAAAGGGRPQQAEPQLTGFGMFADDEDE